MVVDRLTKSVYFILVKSTYSAEDYARIFIDDIVFYHGIPLSIISNKGAQFTSRFWRSFQKGLGTKEKLSTLQSLEDMLKACIIDFKGNWDSHFPLVEFSYNNSYHSSISMAPIVA